MFDNLTERLTGIFSRLQGKGRLTEKDIDDALGQVRRSLLEADVNFRVARDFVAAVKERALDNEVMTSLSPGQQVVKIVHDELTAMLSAGDHRLTPSSRLPAVLMLVGLQGSGKTTTASKLALQMKRQNHSPMLIAADLRRPAAISQLETLGKQVEVPVYAEAPAKNTPARVAAGGVKRAAELAHTWAIVDTGGRLHIDDELMSELEEVKKAVSPHQTILVVDAMTGQDAVNAAQEFHARIGLDGLIMSKMDGGRAGRGSAVDHEGDRGADQVHWRRGTEQRAGGFLSRPDGVPDSGDGRCDDADRAGAGGGGRGEGAGAGTEDADGRLYAGGFSGSDTGRQKDGRPSVDHGYDARHGQEVQAVAGSGGRSGAAED